MDMYGCFMLKVRRNLITYDIIDQTSRFYMKKNLSSNKQFKQFKYCFSDIDEFSSVFFSKYKKKNI